MPDPAEKLAQALELLHQLQEKGRVAIRSSDFRELIANAWSKMAFCKK